MLENTPHDWLFPKVKAVVHHGGAGTTAIGLKCGKPTLVIPFFGDQFFWGNMIGKAGAGAMPIPYKELTAEKLAEAITFLLKDKTQAEADKFAKKIVEEGDGAQNAVKSFHRCLTLRGEQSMRCSILDDRLAVWMVKKTNLRLSALAADILRTERKLKWDDLRLLRHVEWNDFEGPGEPVIGGVTALGGALASAATGVVRRDARGAKAKSKFVEDLKEEIEDDDEEEELDEEPRDLMAGSDDEAELDEEDDEPEHEVKKPAASAKARFEALFNKRAPPCAPIQQKQQEEEEEDEEEGYDEPLEESFEARVAGGEYDDDSISDGRGGQLEQELSDNGLQHQMHAEMGQEYEEDYDAYGPDSVFVRAQLRSRRGIGCVASRTSPREVLKLRGFHHD